MTKIILLHGEGGEGYVVPTLPVMMNTALLIFGLKMDKVGGCQTTYEHSLPPGGLTLNMILQNNDVYTFKEVIENLYKG